MCGRYAEFKQVQDLADAFARQGYLQDVLFADGTADWPGGWNIAPTHDIRMIVDRPFTQSMTDTLVTAGGSRSEALITAAEQTALGNLPAEFISDDLVRQVRRARWGLVPSWAKDPAIGSKMINARSETIMEKPSFRKAFAARRCIIPANGYYEWSTLAGPSKQKVPHYIYAADGRPLAFAGIYEFWKEQGNDGSGSTDQWLVTASIITAAADGELGEIHARRPVFLQPDAFNDWLSPHTTSDEAMKLIHQPLIEISHHVVSTDVNKVANQGPHLIVPA